ncbi:efflux transporter outer membrane subunit [Dyella caseinilytica]|uniref:Efflux transporter outer membrane subunit n=1 Tax=Dyella caseinilytica TaxID=1849581 RepID=A0ABX7GUV7_9GAMM|nr:efflux transporter outer membrane subunit [Dyella caseinilytica]QRN54075.1 efflux transporter outer membrane subunit [Dyella caseinilytica]GFZ91401.1 histidine kinase [Dyella caseinilytica]
MYAIQIFAFKRTSCRLLTLGIALALGACAVGPDFHRPAAPASQDYAPNGTPASTASTAGPDGGAQQFVRGMDIPGQWWTLFHSEPLNALIDDSIKHNPDVAAAQEALRSAMENVRAQQGQFFPQVTASVDPTRQKTGSVIASGVVSNATLYNLTTAQLSVSYTPDLWGANRRSVESLVAQADAQRFQLEATYLTLTTNVVNAAVTEAALRAQIVATQDMIDSQQKILDANRKQLALGDMGDVDIAAQVATLEQTRATLPPLQKQLAQQRDLLAVLSGRTPDQDIQAKFELEGLQLPEDLPMSLPARLVEQRPDVRMAEANLHAACAQVGVAFAARLPNISISANGGSAADQMHDLFGHGTSFWNLGAAITAPIFDGGTLKHRQRAAEAAYRQAAEQYRSTVMSALQNMADSLHATQSDADALVASSRAERAAARSLEISQRQYAVGDISMVALLNAQVTYRQAELTLIQARQARYADSVALFQAVGGGWWNRQDVAASTGFNASK